MKEPTTALYGEFARLGKALASARRIELLSLLDQGPRTVDVLAAETGASAASTSQHLKVLREARMVVGDKDGLFVTYRVASADVTLLLQLLKTVAASQLAEVAAVRERLSASGGEVIPPADYDRLLRRVARGEVVLIDVRPGREFEAGHLPGARSVPLPELAAFLDAQAPGRPIVAYCRGPFCAYAGEAVQRLLERGFDAARIEVGVPQWRQAGRAVEVAS